MYGLNLFLTTFTVFSIPYPNLTNTRLLASIVLLFIWMKMKDFLRLFDTTAFFIKLID